MCLACFLPNTPTAKPVNRTRYVPRRLQSPQGRGRGRGEKKGISSQLNRGHKQIRSPRAWPFAAYTVESVDSLLVYSVVDSETDFIVATSTVLPRASPDHASGLQPDQVLPSFCPKLAWLVGLLGLPTCKTAHETSRTAERERQTHTRAHTRRRRDERREPAVDRSDQRDHCACGTSVCLCLWLPLCGIVGVAVGVNKKPTWTIWAILRMPPAMRRS